MRIFAAIAILVCLAPQAASAQLKELQQSLIDGYKYTARVDGRVRAEGEVVASGLRWSCKEDTCTIKGPWPAPGVTACAALAKQIGQISYYGRQGAVLSAKKLAECNKGAPPPLSMVASSSTKADDEAGTTETTTTASSSESSTAPVCSPPAGIGGTKINRRTTSLGVLYERVCRDCGNVSCDPGDVAISGGGVCSIYMRYSSITNFVPGPGCSGEITYGWTASCANPTEGTGLLASSVRVLCLEQ